MHNDYVIDGHTDSKARENHMVHNNSGYIVYGETSVYTDAI